MSFTLVGPAQADESRVYELASLQLAGFFYALTYDFDQRVGGIWLGGFFPLTFSSRPDWGNPLQRWFMATVVAWQPRVLGTIADGFFRVAIRRHPELVVWSWALEWNQSLRVIGFVGEAESVEAIKSSAPDVPMDVLGRLPDGSELRMRSEVALDPGDDLLFSPDDPRT